MGEPTLQQALDEFFEVWDNEPPANVSNAVSRLRAARSSSAPAELPDVEFLRRVFHEEYQRDAKLGCHPEAADPRVWDCTRRAAEFMDAAARLTSSPENPAPLERPE